MKSYFQRGIENYQNMIDDRTLMDSVESAVDIISHALAGSYPVLVCGNGGSASDALHISGELVGRFNLSRPALNVICLNSNVTVMTAWANDVGYDSVFARQVQAHGAQQGVLWGLSTSGSSPSVVQAFRAAAQLGMKTIAFTGQSGGELAELADVLLNVPADGAPQAQELHIPLYHFICAEVEKRLYASLDPENAPLG